MGPHRSDAHPVRAGCAGGHHRVAVPGTQEGVAAVRDEANAEKVQTHAEDQGTRYRIGPTSHVLVVTAVVVEVLVLVLVQ